MIVVVVVMMVVVVVGAATTTGAGCLLLLQAMALVVLRVLVWLPGRTSMTGRGKLANVQLAALPGGSSGRQRRRASPESPREGRRSAKQQGQVIPRGCRSSPIVGAVVALETWALLLLLE